ncbi:MAG: putative activation/secretion protein, partial [Rhizobacter sp.]|nr:putative activation/secretion protein [Rhizobacter sp.]
MRRALRTGAATVLTAAAGWCCGADAATASNGFEAASAAPAAPAVNTPAGVRCVVVNEVVLKGDLAERFAFALRESHDDTLPRCLDELGINELLQRTQTAIVAAGYATTRVLAEPQDLADGRLELTVVAGRIARIRIEGADPERANGWNALPMGEGDLLNVRDIEQALENFKRVPTVEADIRIAPSDAPSEPGRSDLLIAWKQSFPWRLGAALDDAGARATGKLQGSVTFSYDHWWLLYDLFYASLSHLLEGVGSSGFDSGPKANQGHVLHYSLPFGHWLLAATASRNRYRQSVAGASQTYVYGGDSGNTELRLARLLHRDAASKTHVWVKGWSRSSRNFIDDTEVEVQRRKVGGWELGVEHQQHVGEARVDLRFATRRGTGAF